MKKLTLALVACVLTAAAAKADGVTLSGGSVTGPVGGTVEIIAITSITTTGVALNVELGVTSGPDAGDLGTTGLGQFDCPVSQSPYVCTVDFSITYDNNGTPGVDTITATSRTGSGSTFTDTTTVTWVGSTTGAPEPGTLSLLGAALAGSLALRRRIAR